MARKKQDSAGKKKVKRVQWTTTLDPEKLRLLRMIAVDKGTAINVMMEEWIDQLAYEHVFDLPMPRDKKPTDKD